MTRRRARAHTTSSEAAGSAVDRRARRRHDRKHVAADPAIERALLERQKFAFARTAGILADAENPDWETPEKTSAWVRKLRAVDNQAMEDRPSLRPGP